MNKSIKNLLKKIIYKNINLKHFILIFSRVILSFFHIKNSFLFGVFFLLEMKLIIEK